MKRLVPTNFKSRAVCITWYYNPPAEDKWNELMENGNVPCKVDIKNITILDSSYDASAFEMSYHTFQSIKKEIDMLKENEPYMVPMGDLC